MPMSIHPTKRRRLDGASSALSQPFKSPLKAPSRRAEDVGEHSAASKLHSHGINKAAVTDSRPSKTQSTTNPFRQPPPVPLTTNRANRDPQLIDRQRQQSALLLRLSKLRQSLDTAQQALKIESSNIDVELEVLISKWKLASREAAEEVFQGARDRINRMGGMGAWRAQERNQMKSQRWDEEPPVDVEDLSEAQKEQLAAQKAEVEAERREYAPEKADQQIETDDTCDDDDSFTMDMMLQSLNIDLDVIGYDKENQRWHD